MTTPEQTARATAEAIYADVIAGRVPPRKWDEGFEQQLDQAADKAITERLFAEAGLAG